MTGRERLIRLFNNQEIDRIPIWLLAPFHPIGCYVDIYKLPCYKRVVEAIDKYCVTFDRRNYDYGFCRNANPNISLENFTEQNGDNVIRGKRMKYKDFELTSYVSKGKDNTKIKKMIDDIDDLMKILEIPYVQPIPDTSAYQREKEELGDRGVMMMSIGDPLVVLYSLMSVEDFAIFTLTEFDKLTEFLDEIYKRMYNDYKYLLENNIGEVFFIVGAEFAGPPVVSPKKFNALSVKYVKGIVDLVRAYGKKSIVHYHGNLYQVLDGIKEINPDGLHTIEAPPIGDCTITQAREKLGNMILIGNIQYDDFRSMTPDQMEQAVKSVIEEGKNGRFILSPTAGPYEENISPQFVDNYIAFVKAGYKYGKLK